MKKNIMGAKQDIDEAVNGIVDNAIKGLVTGLERLDLSTQMTIASSVLITLAQRGGVSKQKVLQGIFDIWDTVKDGSPPKDATMEDILKFIEEDKK